MIKILISASEWEKTRKEAISRGDLLIFGTCWKRSRVNRTHKQTQARHELAMNKIRLELDRQPTFMHIKNDRKILMSLNNKHMKKTNRNEAIPAPSTATTSEKTYSVVLSKELKLALKKSRRHRHLFLFCSPFKTFFVPLFVLFCFWPLAS